MSTTWHLFGPDREHPTVAAVVTEARQWWADHAGTAPMELHVRAGSGVPGTVEVRNVPPGCVRVVPLPPSQEGMRL